MTAKHKVKFPNGEDIEVDFSDDAATWIEQDEF